MNDLPYMKAPCAQCPFKKSAREGWLGADRMKEILDADSFTCHKNADKQCAGHMIIKGDANTFVDLANRLGFKLTLKGSDMIFSTEAACIAHHGA